ncbi:hypothetical protein [Aporhodopirellula aestuarii]|uniref:DUF2029 domain-containing protein n=1 Tax=Aporhodopirellula aestuarii TaxID=2950107 RepID=A0ABT0U058_9BACT|nr:hypothetical protein [Aporhodopirellula aestuarii]MCM2370206.1 hypothetical protein [Aporhodopirellula aestuarii]
MSNEHPNHGSLREHTSRTGDVRRNLTANSAVTKRLAGIAIISTLFYGIIAWLSWRFELDSAGVDRPIVLVLILFAAAFIAYVFASLTIMRGPANSHTLKLIMGAAVIFRVVMLFSLPIQEVDLYRYLWDGAVGAEGVSPFTFSPEDVRNAVESPTENAELARLVALLHREPPLAEILDHVHFPELPTIYPPTSQAVFAAVSLLTPNSASLLTRVLIIKAVLIAFDLATLILVIQILRLCKRPVALCISYAWCPLIMKEVANSGHLDAIAVFLTTLAVYMFARSLQAPRGHASRLGKAAAAFVLALGVGAKLYPVVLVPLFATMVYRRDGMRAVLMPAILFAATATVLLIPLSHNRNPDADPSRGVVTFLQRWEMNDFLFALVNENLKPEAGQPPHDLAWYSVMPESFRTTIIENVASRMNVPVEQAPYLITRFVTGLIFLLISFSIAWKAANPADQTCDPISVLGASVFLTLAWFWLLCPTQNPWYWTWTLPFLPFAKSRVWLAMSGLVLVYYLRFWLGYHFPTTAVLGSRYTGTAFFDSVVTWIEFAPWFGCLIAVHLYRRWRLNAATASNESGHV